MHTREQPHVHRIERRQHFFAVFAFFFLLSLPPVVGPGPTSGESVAAVPPAGMQTFADIVQSVTPAVVNVAVVGGGGGGRREGRRPLPPGPFGGPPGGGGEEPPGMGAP